VAYYIYVCNSCSYRQEISHSMFQEPLTICPQCGQGTFVREIGVPIVFVSPSDNTGTLGSLADRQAARLSDERKHELDMLRPKPRKYMRDSDGNRTRIQ
jgi:putative FmdB family regulatory protein